jgi:hypothetical protein
MWKNEKETRKRWSSMVEFEKDVYRLIENYSAKTALGGSRFFGGGDEGKAKKRLACAAIGAFPTKKMTGGDVDVDDVEFDLPEIDWHHYQLRSYGQGKGGRDIAWTNIRADAIRSVLGTDDKMRVPYTERAYYRAQELYQAAPTRVPREDEDIPVSVRTVSMDVSSTAGKTRMWAGKEVLPDWMYTNSTQNIQGFTPSDILLAIKGGKVEMGARAASNLKQFVKGSLGHDEATDSVLVHYHGFVAGKPFDVVNMGQFGLHIGTKEAAMLRNYKLGFARNIPADKTYNSLMPLVVNIKKPLRMADRGLWSAQSVAESILASLLPDQREAVHENNYEGASSRARIKQDIGDVTDADIKFLREFIDKQKQINANKPNQYAAAQMDLISTGMGSEMLTPAFQRIANEAYQQSLPLHNWLKSKGIDSIAYWNTSEGRAWSYIIFDGKNAKHISENTGEFSPDNISMFQQHASDYGAKNAEQSKNLMANWEQAVKEGDIFKSIAIKDNFLADMPVHTTVIRQTAEEAIKQGVSIDHHNSQFKTGSPVVFVGVHGTDDRSIATFGRFDDEWMQGRKKEGSHGGGLWMASHMQVAKHFAKAGGFIARGLVKSKNPLVVNANELHWASPKLKIDFWLKKAKDAGHDSLIFLNILDDINESYPKPDNQTLLTHNQYVIFPPNLNDNIAIIDSSQNLRANPVPRGLGLINDVPLELPFLQQADNANQGKQEAKRTFYSAVEKFVEEKITDKTSLNELMGLLDPTRGTGIVKSELEFLDIAGWVEEQKKINGGTKAKVNKEALLEYIKTHKFVLQEDKTNKAWYTMEGVDPNNPAIQSQIEGGYEGFTAANKGFDELHSTENYRVLLLRADGSVDFARGGPGHFDNKENIIAFARVSDVWLDRETEIPSPPVQSEFPFLRKFLSEDETVSNRTALDTANYQIRMFLEGTPLTFEELKSLSSEEIYRRLGATDFDVYETGERLPSKAGLSPFGFTLHKIYMALNPEKKVEFGRKFADIMDKYVPNDRSVFSFLADQETNRLNSGDEDRVFIFGSVDAVSRSIKENIRDEDGNLYTKAKTSSSGKLYTETGRTTTIAQAESAYIAMVDLLKSYIKDDSQIVNPNAGKKKMLFVQELQSDNAQNMQKRNDARVPKGESTSIVMSEQEFKRMPEMKAEIEKGKKLLKAWDKWYDAKDSLLDQPDLVDNNFEEATLSVSEKLGGRDTSAVINDKIAGGKQNFIDNLIVLVDRMIAADSAGEKTYAETNKGNLIAIRERISRNGNVSVDDLISIDRIEQYGMLRYEREGRAGRLPYYNHDYFRGLIADIIHEDKEKNRAIKTIGKSLHEELTKRVFREIFDSTASRWGDFAGFWKTDDFSKRNLYSIIEQKINEYLADVDSNGTLENNPIANIWEAWMDHAIRDKNSMGYAQLREKVLRDVVQSMEVFENSRTSGSPVGGEELQMLNNIASKNSIVLTESMPFLRTEDFSKLMFKKLLKEVVDSGDYEGMILIPSELPEKIVGGKSGYFYSTILPKVMNNYAKKFGAKLRENKSISDYKQDPLFDMIGRYLKEEAKDPNYGYASKAYDASLQAAKVWLSSSDNPSLQSQVRDRITSVKTTKYGFTKEQAEQIFDYFVQVVQGTRPDSQKSWGIKDGTWTGDGDIAKQASRRGLILDRTPQMDAIKDGQPMWQAAPKRKKAGAGEPETVGDVQGVPKKPRDRSVGEYESPVPMPVIPKTTKEEASAPVNGIEQSKVAQQLIKEGVANYRGFKFVVNKENEIEIFNPAGKRVTITQQFLDKATGQTVLRKVNTAPFPDDAITLVDKYIGGRQQTQGETQADRLGSPAKVNPATAETQVVKPAERAIPVDKAMDDLGVVESQVKAGGIADYYGIFKVGFDQKMGKYYAMDNGKQMVSLLVPSPFQSGPRTMSGQYHPDLASVLQQLDKKFDKTKYQSKSPSALVSAQRPAPAVSATPVAPQAPVEAPSKPTPAPKRVEASAVPPAVTEATRQLPPKPKAQPTRKPKASIPEKAPIAPTQATKAPEVVMPEPVAPEVVAPKQEATPVEVVTDKEYMEKQAKALGKGFIEMLKDPTLSKYIIESLNVDDNLTLKGTSEDASTADGRFSVVKKGRKLEVVQNNYVSPITGITYNRKPIAYVNTIQQAQIVIRRLELERTIALKSRNMRAENGLAVLASENPAFVELARIKEIKENAFIQMLLSMRDQNITPIMIDPVTLEPLLVMMPSEPAVAQVTRPKRTVQIAGMLPEYGTEGEPMPLALIDRAITFNMFEDAEIRGLDYNTKATAMRFTNALGYQILKFNGKYRLFNPMKASISVRDDETSIIDDLIRDIHRNGLQK